MRTGALAIALMLALPAAGSSGESASDPISISVVPSACVAPCSVRVAVRVFPDQTNRSLTIAAESIAFYRSSTRPLEGDHGPRLHELILHEIPAGLYDVRATVTRSNGSPQQYSTRFAVGGGP
jgi:hypothetical protein